MSRKKFDSESEQKNAAHVLATIGRHELERGVTTCYQYGLTETPGD